MKNNHVPHPIIQQSLTVWQTPHNTIQSVPRALILKQGFFSNFAFRETAMYKLQCIHTTQYTLTLFPQHYYTHGSC